MLIIHLENYNYLQSLLTLDTSSKTYTRIRQFNIPLDIRKLQVSFIESYWGRVLMIFKLCNNIPSLNLEYKKKSFYFNNLKSTKQGCIYKTVKTKPSTIVKFSKYELESIKQSLNLRFRKIRHELLDKSGSISFDSVLKPRSTKRVWISRYNSKSYRYFNMFNFMEKILQQIIS